MSKSCAIRCACGLVCSVNRDCLLADPGRGAYCVCNGVDLGRAASVASHLVRAEIGRAVATAGTLSERIPAVDRAVAKANDALRTKAARDGVLPPESTVAVLLTGFGQDGVRAAAVGWVGDCRVYRFRAGRLECLTRDHVVGNVPSMQRPGLRAMRARACLRALTRAVGADESVPVDWRKLDVAEGDGYLVCTGGVHSMLSEARIAAAFAEVASAESVADRIESGVICAGAKGNYSMIVCR